MSLIIGLTGGIGSGKSFASHLFAKAGVPIIDTDHIAHEVTGPGGSAVEAIVQRFGTAYLTAEQGIDRPRLRQFVFKNTTALTDLNAITHPLIRSALDIQTQAYASAAYVIQIIPLLIESSGWRTHVDRVLVVDCPPETQIARVIQRSQLSHTEVLDIMAQQVSRENRLSCADDVLDNREDASPSLAEQVQTLHLFYSSLANIE